MFFSYGYVVFVGLEWLVNYLENLMFSDFDIVYLCGLEVYFEGFLEYL